jgi:DNA-directed RNA polymerase specialized sigma24 family protein
MAWATIPAGYRGSRRSATFDSIMSEARPGRRVAALREATLPDEVSERVPPSAEVRAKITEVWKTPALQTRFFKIAYSICREKLLAKELMEEATMRVLEGRRRWDTQKQPDALVYLGGVVGSLWTHLKTKAQLHEEADDQNEVVDASAQRIPNPQVALIEKEEAVEREAIRVELETEFGTSRRAQQLMELMQDGVFDPAEQARLLDLGSDEIKVLRKRLRRALHRVVERRKERAEANLAARRAAAEAAEKTKKDTS